MIIDCHVHLIGMSPERGCMVGKKLGSGLAYHLLTRSLGLGGVARHELDAAYADRLITWVRASQLDGACLLAFDGVYDQRGQLDRARTQLLVGNDYCLEVCARDEKLWPICSVNPQRADALEELERVAKLGALAIKTLPNSMGFDPANPAYVPFWQRMQALGLALLTHTSFEHTIPPISQLYGKPERLRSPLEQGVQVIAAHCAGAGSAHPLREDFHTWHAMLREHENLWGDLSAMGSLSRFQYISKVLSSPLARERVLMGSDFPVPPSPLIFAPRLGLARARALAALANPLQKNLELLRALGVGPEIMARAATVLKLA